MFQSNQKIFLYLMKNSSFGGFVFNLALWQDDRIHIFILEKNNKLILNINTRPMSSFYFFVQPPALNSTYIPEEIQGFYSTTSNHQAYSPQQFFINPTFNTMPIGFTEIPCFASQQEFMMPTTHSLPPVNTQTHEVKEPKKRQRNSEKQIESAKKNSQSNLINHYFSFFNTRQKSEKMVEACITSVNNQKESHKEKLLHLFFNTIHVVNARRGRRYVNKKSLLSLFEPDELLKTVPEIKERISKINQITIEELCQVFRKCCFSFYRTYSIDSILTSKRISAVAKEEHFRKRRKVVKAFFDKQ